VEPMSLIRCNLLRWNAIEYLEYASGSIRGRTTELRLTSIGEFLFCQVPYLGASGLTSGCHGIGPGVSAGASNLISMDVDCIHGNAISFPPLFERRQHLYDVGSYVHAAQACSGTDHRRVE
jgi:hypothetical protein